MDIKERLQIVLNNEKRDINKLKFEKEQIEEQIKKAPLMTINGGKRLQQIEKQLKEKTALYNRLYWIMEG